MRPVARVSLEIIAGARIVPEPSTGRNASPWLEIASARTGSPPERAAEAAAPITSNAARITSSPSSSAKPGAGEETG